MTVTFDELRATEAGRKVLWKMFMGGRRPGTTNFNEAWKAYNSYVKYGDNVSSIYTKRATHVFNKHARTVPNSMENVDVLHETLKNTDWSHYKAHSKGGHEASWNGEFENASHNRARGNERWNSWESKKSREFLNKKAQLISKAQFIAKLEAALNKAIHDAITAAVIGAIIGGAGAFIVNLPKYLKGEITNVEYAWRILKAATVSGVVSGGIAFVISLITSLIPGAGTIVQVISTTLLIKTVVWDLPDIIDEFVKVFNEYKEVYGDKSRNVNKVAKEYVNNIKQLSLNTYEDIKEEISIYSKAMTSVVTGTAVGTMSIPVISECMRLQPADESRNWRPYRPRPRYY